MTNVRQRPSPHHHPAGNTNAVCPLDWQAAGKAPARERPKLRVPVKPITDPATARKVASYVRRQFLELLAVALRRPTGCSRRYPHLVWASRDGRIEYARCEPFMKPRPDDRARMLIMRVAINHAEPPGLEAITRRARLMQPETQRLPLADRWQFELSLLPHELPAFVPFVASMVFAHEEQCPERFIEPPCLVHYWPRDALSRDYAWSATAWPIATNYHIREQALMEGWSKERTAAALKRGLNTPLKVPRPFLISLRDDDEAWAYGRSP